MGESSRDSEAKNVQTAYKRLGHQIGGTDFNVNNRFNNFKPAFSYQDKNKTLDELYNKSVGNIKADATEQIKTGQRDTAESLAARGITSGGIVNSSLNKVKSNVGRGRFNALKGLSADRLNQNVGLMEQENQDQFRNTGAAQNVDIQNMLNLFRKFGMLQGNLGGQQSNLGNLDNTTWLDDALAVANTAANFIPGGGG